MFLNGSTYFADEHLNIELHRMAEIISWDMDIQSHQMATAAIAIRRRHHRRCWPVICHHYTTIEMSSLLLLLFLLFVILTRPFANISLEREKTEIRSVLEVGGNQVME